MTEPDRPVRQRLVAILVADVAGYSRLMSLDDQATVRALDAARDFFRDRIAEHAGRVVDMAGDSVLAIFDTAVGALRAALEVQDRLAALALRVAESEPMRFRVGVHLGDVIEKDDGTVYGDGVNIAARLEALAEPGGIAVSQAIESAIHHRLKVRFVDIGAQQVKNIAQPVRAFRCLPLDAHDGSPAAAAAVAAADADVGSEAPRSEPLPPGRRSARRKRGTGRKVLGVVAVVAIVVVGWRVVLPRLVPHAAPAAYSSQDRRMTFAVLPFVAPADDETGRKVATAMAEAVTAFQEKNINWAQVAPRALVQEAVKAHTRPKHLRRELDVHFLLRGVVVADAPGYKVELAVVDTEADRVLESQSLVIPQGALLPKRTAELGRVVGKLTHSALRAEVERARARAPEALDVRDLAFRAFIDWDRAGEAPGEAKAAYDAAAALLNRALTLAPEDPLALYVTALINLCSCVSSWSKDIQEQQAIGTAAMEKYLRQRPENATMLLAKSDLYRHHGRHEESLLVAESVLRRDPESRAAHLFKTSALLQLGRLDEALAASTRQLERVDDDDASVLALAAAVRYRRQEYAGAASLAQKAITLMPQPELADPIMGPVALTLVAAEGQLGHRDRATVALKDFNARVPQATSIAAIKAWMHPSASLSGYEPLYEGLRRAGVAD